MRATGRPASLLKRARRALVDAVVPRLFLVLRGSARGRRVALTFDDGPHELTRAYLDILETFEARATFFLVGKAMVERPDDVAEIQRRGHEIGAHGYSHTPFPDLARDELLDELACCRSLIPSPRTVWPLVRPPYGILSPAVLLHCARARHTTVLWSVDPHDGKPLASAELLDRVAPGRLRAGDIVLLHEGRAWTLEALPAMLAALRDAGIQPVTVGELLSSSSIERHP